MRADTDSRGYPTVAPGRMSPPAFFVGVLLFILAACNDPAGSSAATQSQLGISNGTTLTVTLVVNGRRIGDYAPASGARIELAALPPLPWIVSALTESGRSLTSMQVASQSPWMSPGASELGAAMGRVDLSCGRLTIWAGNIQPSGPMPPPSPGTAGDCEP
jgi:hypothetical protein